MANNWEQAVLGAQSKIGAVILNLNETGLQICLLVDANGVFLGTATDGDVRRGLLRGLTLESPATEIINRSPLVIHPSMGTDIAVKLMQVNKIRQLPVVDDAHRLLGLFIYDELLAPRQCAHTMVIMAGGKGTRLRPYTENCPKPMLEVHGKPMLEHIIERAKREGFLRFVISVHYLAEMIVDYFGDGAKLNVQIDYLRENTPLGTAGAISLLNPRPESSFVITNGDVLTGIHYADLLDYHNTNGASATMATRLFEWQHPFGVVQTNGNDIVGFEEKPISRTNINAGVYVLHPSVLDELTPGEACDMPTLLGRLKRKNAKTIVYPIHENWMDIGQPADLQRAQVLQNV